MASTRNLNTVRQLLIFNIFQKQSFKILKRSKINSFGCFKLQLKSYSTENDSSDSDDEKKIKKSSDIKAEKTSNKSEASKKLTSLLSSIKIEDSKLAKTKSFKLDLAKPGGSKKLKEQVKQKYVEKSAFSVERSSQREEDKIKDAITDVAKSLGGDIKKTEIELLKRLKSQDTAAVKDKESAANLSDLFVGMKIDREKRKSKPYSDKIDTLEEDRASPINERGFKSSQYRSVSDRMLKSPIKVPYQKIDIFGKEPIGFFQNVAHEAETEPKTIWQRLNEQELKLLVTHPPENGFEEMIRWTEQGKLWHFPINNEFGLDEEAKVGFEEHVFLEHHLEGFPTKGPIRHFMELVIVGLSKNPYISVERKIENIDWFRQYFKDKEAFLKEIGTLDDVQQKSGKDTSTTL